MNRLLPLMTGLGLLLAVGCISYEPGPKKPTRAETKLRRAREPKPGYAHFGTNKVYYISTGTGPKTLLFVHGWASNGNFWNEQVPAFEDAARMIFVDLPGHGQSDKPHVNYTVDFLADAVLAVMRDAKVDQATLVGHSMGVAVICRVLAQAPQKVTGLVAVEGSLRMAKISPEEAKKYVAPYQKPDYRDQVKRSVISMFPIRGTDRLRSQVFSEMVQTPQYVLASTMENSFDPSQPAWEPKKLDVPLLVLNAKSVTWTPDYEVYVRSLSARVEYRTFDGVGHFLMLERPAQFNAVLLEMLQKYDLVQRTQ